LNERRFSGDIERLRLPERLERMEVTRVVDLCLQGLAAPEKSPLSVLDVGVGSGVFAEAFAARGLQVAGVDVNPEMIPAAQAYVPQGDFHQAPAEAVPFPDAAFDLVFLGLVFHETDDALKALQEARRLARQRAAILDWPYEEQPFGPPLAHRVQPEALQALAHQAGFRSTTALRLANLALYLLEP
jgi:ubiquinone/menaquinone biosynthesis C-methylase UbiE